MNSSAIHIFPCIRLNPVGTITTPPLISNYNSHIQMSVTRRPHCQCVMAITVFKWLCPVAGHYHHHRPFAPAILLLLPVVTIGKNSLATGIIVIAVHRVWSDSSAHYCWFVISLWLQRNFNSQRQRQRPPPPLSSHHRPAAPSRLPPDYNKYSISQPHHHQPRFLINI